MLTDSRGLWTQVPTCETASAAEAVPARRQAVASSGARESRGDALMRDSLRSSGSANRQGSSAASRGLRGPAVLVEARTGPSPTAAPPQHTPAEVSRGRAGAVSALPGRATGWAHDAPYYALDASGTPEQGA